MSKGKRLKRERSEAGTFSTIPVVSRAPLPVLGEAVIAVGDVFGTTPSCAKAAALLYETARLLGYQLVVRPVSVLAHHVPTDTWVFMGPRASEKIPDQARARIENRLPDGKDNGHLILTCDDPLLLFDPNIRQLGSYGLDTPSLIIRISSTHPDEGAWNAEHDGLQLQYILDEDNRTLVKRFDELVKGFASDAEILARMLRAGATAETMRSLRA